MKKLDFALILILGIAIITALGCVAPQKEKAGITPTITPIPTAPIITPTPTPTPLPPPTLNTLPPDTLYVVARMLKPSYWGPERYGLDSLEVEIYNQREETIKIRAQIIAGEQILEERTFTLTEAGNSVSFSNEKRYFTTTPNIVLRLIVEGYKAVDYKFREVGTLS